MREIQEIKEFFDEYERAPMALVVYVSDEDRKAKIVANAERLKLKMLAENTTNMQALRSLTTSHICIVSDALLMRGFDFRCSNGISLLIADKLDSARAYTQALGRCGRHTDPYRRNILETAMPGFEIKAHGQHL